MRQIILIITAFVLSVQVSEALPQAQYFNSARMVEESSVKTPLPTDTVPLDTVVSFLTLPGYFFMPAVYDNYRFPDSVDLVRGDFSGNPGMRWVEEQQSVERRMRQMRRTLFYTHPEEVRYNVRMLPEAPKPYYAVVSPEDYSIDIRQSVEGPDDRTTLQAEEVEKRHWIRTFNVGLQFSQAYISPNWYQGGNRSLIALGNIYYNVKLNQEYHPNLLFETTLQYKLGTNHTPEDSLHSYTVTEDLLQFNSTFGIKAAEHWYYSVTGQFKTQLLNSYKTNDPKLQSAFLSPSDLTVGVGMTYNYARPSGNLTFDATISPLSYNLRTCINERVDASSYDIDTGKKAVNKIGFSTEIKLMWKLTYNITLTSRIFAFSDYQSVQADWENTLAFVINKFLTTQIYAHLRYDTLSPRIENSDWHKLQVKEIFSIGFSYSFSSI